MTMHQQTNSIKGLPCPWRKLPRGMTVPRRLRGFVCVVTVACAVPAHAQTVVEARSNYFNDPFVRATSGLARCPIPEGPLYTATEVRAQSHIRAEKGTTCHYYGRCRLPNAYLYDAEIIPRVARFIQLDPRFKDSSIWLLGQRRWVYLQGCIASRALAEELVREVKLIDDVESVVDQLMVGFAGQPPYAVAGGVRP